MKLTINIDKDDMGDHIVVIPELPEVITSGSTIEEAILLACDAIVVAIKSRVEMGIKFDEADT